MARSIFPLVIRRRAFLQSVDRIKQRLGEEKVKALSKRLELEYQSLNLLLVVIPFYIILTYCMNPIRASLLIVLVFGAVILIISFSANSGYAYPLQIRNISSVWVATFLSISSFNNAGLSPVDDNLISLSFNPPLLITLSFLIIMGNTGQNLSSFSLNLIFYRLSSRVKRDYHFSIKSNSKIP